MPPKNKGRRSAEKAQLSRGATPRIGCCHPNALRARMRVQRDALASRRSTAALAEALTPQLSSGPRFLEPPGANGRTLPGASAASSSRTGHSAGRAGPRSRPGAECVVPPAGTALAPLSKAPSRRCPSRARYFAFKLKRRRLSNAVAALDGVRHCKSLKQRLCCRETLDRNDVDRRCDRNRKSIRKPQRFAKGVFCMRVQMRSP